MSNQVELTAERVDHAVRAILERQQTPSVAALKAELGGGDEGRINSLYQDWLDTHDNSIIPAEPEGVAMPATPTVPQRVLSVLDSLYDAILQELDTQADRVRRERDMAAQGLVEEARTMRAEAEQTVAETDARLAAMTAEIGGLRDDIAALEAAKQGLEAEVHRSREAVSASRGDADRASADRDRLAAELAELARRHEDAMVARDAALREAATLRGERDAYRRIVERDRIASGGRGHRPKPRRTPG